MGVSSGYNPVVGDLICQKITEGGSLTSICKLPGFPQYALICRWKRTNESFRKQLAEAREDRAEALRDSLLLLSDNVAEDSDAIAKVRNQVEARKWCAAADSPAIYGSRKEVTTQAQAVTIIVNTGIQREKPVEETDVGSV